jgi:Limiting CO2-inducible proteins B/C beta carbonyic anhydrases
MVSSTTSTMPLELCATEWVYQQHQQDDSRGRRQPKDGVQKTNETSYGTVVLVTTTLSLMLWCFLNRRSRQTLFLAAGKKGRRTAPNNTNGDTSPKIRHLTNHTNNNSSSRSVMGSKLPWKFRIPAVLSPSNKKTNAQIHKWFPGAMVSHDVVRHIQDTLAPHDYNFKRDTTVLATSLCCDKINRPFQQELLAMYDHHCRLGGLAGVPFGGVAAFEASAFLALCDCVFD